MADLVTKLVRLGDDLVLVIDRALLDTLEINAETELTVTVTDGGLVVSPSRGPDRQARIRSAVERANERFGTTFKKLAES